MDEHDTATTGRRDHHSAPAQSATDALGARDVRTVFERIDQGYCVCEIVRDDAGGAADYRFLEVNARFEEMTGLSGAVGRTALELVPDLERHWVDTYARVGLGGETVRFQQGSEAMGRWFDVFATPLDVPGRFAIVFRDETARHRAELALARSAERFRAMADDLPLIVWLHGADGQQEFVNQTFCDFFGVDRAAMTADRWQPLLHPDDAQAYVDGFLAAVEERSAFHQRARVRDARGRWRWMESWARPRFDADGRFLGHIGTSADVTEQVGSEEARAEAARFLRRVLDSLFTFVGVLEPDGTLVEANRAPLDIAGLTYDDVIGRKFWDCYWWSHDEAVQRRLADAVGRAVTGDVVRYDECIRVADDGFRWIDFQLVPLTDDEGRVTHVIPSGLDITGRVEAEQVRAEYMRLEQRRRARAEILEANATRVAAVSSVREIAGAVLELLKEALGLEVAAVNYLRDGVLTTVTGPGVHPDSIDDAAAVVLSADLPGPIAIRTNSVLALGALDEVLARFPDLDAATRRYTLESLLAVPVRSTDGPPLGALVVASADRDAFDEELRSLIADLADQAGAAMQRALLHEQVLAAHQREHEIAVRLQRALLPDRLVEDPRLEIAARYEAAGAHLDVGGDWYDTHRWPDGRIGVLVGDVVGHDLEAAAAMGRIRSATAALAATIPADAAALLDALHQVALGPGGSEFVTAVAMVIDPESGSLTYSTAGHPPPLLLTADGSRWLDDAHHPPLGQISIDERVVRTVALAPGDVVVVYTDGLVERRDRSIDTGLDRLRADALLHRDAPVAELLDRLVASAAGGGFQDDVVAVAVRWNPIATGEPLS